MRRFNEADGRTLERFALWFALGAIGVVLLIVFLGPVVRAATVPDLREALASEAGEPYTCGELWFMVKAASEAVLETDAEALERALTNGSRAPGDTDEATIATWHGVAAGLVWSAVENLAASDCEWSETI